MGERGLGLYEFLAEAELQQYYSAFKTQLKVQNVSQLKYVTDEDLADIGLSKPESRRLKKFFQKHFPQTYLSKFKKKLSFKREDQSLQGSPVPPPRTTKPQVKVPSKHIIPIEAIVVNKELGTGEFGVVQQGVWTNEEGERTQVAIKRLSKEAMQSNPLEFLKEAAIMHSIDTEHIVRLYGVVLDSDSLMLVTELAPLRSLLECLKEPALRASFHVLALCDFAVQICDGMAYLEGKRLIHRDLAARNILVFSKDKVKISDFGLSRALGVGKNYYQTNFNVNLKLPIAWCAPECINYLRFTSASDVWAFAVTLWEMFSYGFQPWAALTGQQILEAIDHPHFQRLEQPEHCPREYYTQIMCKCWAHDPSARPSFVRLLSMLPDVRPEQVQAIQDNFEPQGRDELAFRNGDIITVLDKRPESPGASCIVWKGALPSGRTGFFNPSHTVTYLGTQIPSSSNREGAFPRGDGKNMYSSRRRLRPEMISGPQGEVRHTGHVGIDGAFFGDVPKQVVAPFRHEPPSGGVLKRASSDVSDKAPLLTPTGEKGGRNGPASEHLWPDLSLGNSRPATALGLRKDGGMGSSMGSLKSGSHQLHDYHEISDEEGAGNSPQFETMLDLSGPSLMEEVFSALSSGATSKRDEDGAKGGKKESTPIHSPNETTNVRNELKEMAWKALRRGERRKGDQMKPISADEEEALESAISIARELAAKSLHDLQADPNESPTTPVTPSKRKFFRFPSGTSHHSHHEGGGRARSTTSSEKEERHLSDLAASIPDIQDSIPKGAREAYNNLIENPLQQLRLSENDLQPRSLVGAQKIPLAATNSAPQPLVSSPTEEENPLRRLKGVNVVRPKVRGNKHSSTSIPPTSSPAVASSKPRPAPLVIPNSNFDAKPERHDYNPLPLPPKSRSSWEEVPPARHHQRKHPLVIPEEYQEMMTGDILDDVGKRNSEPLPSPPAKPPRLVPNAVLNEGFENAIAASLDSLDSLPSGTRLPFASSKPLGIPKSDSFDPEGHFPLADDGDSDQNNACGIGNPYSSQLLGGIDSEGGRIVTTNAVIQLVDPSWSHNGSHPHHPAY